MTTILLLLALTGSDTTIIHSLQEAQQTAQKQNPTLAVYQQQTRQARYDYQATKGAFYPNASAAFNATDNLHLATTPVPGELIGQPGTTFYAQFGRKYTYSTGITLTQNIVNWQAVLQTKIADNNLALSKLQQSSYEQSLKEQVTRSYFSVLIAKASLSIIQKDEAISDSITSLTKQRLDEGTGDAIALNQAIINRNTIRQNKALSQQLYDQGLENLKIILNIKPDDELALAEYPNADSLAATANPTIGPDKNLDVYRQQVLIADLTKKQQRSNAYPSLSATGYLGVQQFRNDFGLSFNDNDWSGYRYVGINLSVPIFTGLSNTNKVRSAATRATIAQMQYETAKDQSAINDRITMKNQTDYQNLTSASQESFHLYGDNLTLNKQKFSEGVITIDAYLKNFQDYLTAENTYMNNLSQLLSIRATVLSRL